MKKIKKAKKEYKVSDFQWVIPVEVIENQMDKRTFKKFMKFMGGQTVMSLKAQAGIYACDLGQFLAGKPCLD